MGCWNATCNVSRLPIFCGDEIVVIPLIAVSATVTANTSYATDNFVPFSFPIVGKYNDYGGIEDAVITEENDKLIRSYEFYKSNGDGTAPYKVEIGDDMEKFISEELCGWASTVIPALALRAAKRISIMSSRSMSSNISVTILRKARNVIQVRIPKREQKSSSFSVNGY